MSSKEKNADHALGQVQGTDVLRDFRSLTCRRGILGFAEYITHFTGALMTIREGGINAPPPQKNLIGMVMSNAKEEPFKSHLEAYLKENKGEGEVTIDMFLEECVALINFALYQKGATLDADREGGNPGRNRDRDR